jgi:hypothetical protein
VSFLVTAPCVIAKDQEGKNHHRYEGDVIAWLSDEQAEHFVSSGLVERTDKGVGGSDSVEAEANGDKPPANAKKADLVAWLTANAVKEDGSDYTEAELDAMKVPELRELVDSIED